MTKYKKMTAEEALTQFEADPEFVARRAAAERSVREATERRLRAEQPLVEALREVGYRVESVWDLVNTRARYPSAVPVLLEHLQRAYPPDVLAGIARALAIPEARFAWPLLRKLYMEASDAAPYELKSAFACALSGAADDEVLDDMADLVRDTAHGASRILLLANLASSNRRDMHDVLRAAIDDPVLTKEAKFLVRRLRERSRKPRT